MCFTVENVISWWNLVKTWLCAVARLAENNSISSKIKKKRKKGNKERFLRTCDCHAFTRSVLKCPFTRRLIPNQYTHTCMVMYMNDKCFHKIPDFKSVYLVRVPSSWYHVIGDIIISSVLLVCRTYQNIRWVYCDSYSQVEVRVHKTHYPSSEIDSYCWGNDNQSSPRCTYSCSPSVLPIRKVSTR